MSLFYLYAHVCSTNRLFQYLLCNWRASEASETLSGVTNGNRRYMVRARHFSSAGPVLRNVGGVKCEPFLKHSNYW